LQISAWLGRRSSIHPPTSEPSRPRAASTAGIRRFTLAVHDVVAHPRGPVPELIYRGGAEYEGI